MRIAKILFILFSFLTLGAIAQEVEFIHITDINLTPRNAYGLLDTIEEINSYKSVDFVVFGGNNIAKANIDNLNTFLYLLKKVHKKTYVLLGSNDVFSPNGIDKKYYLSRVRRALLFRHSSKPNYVFKKKGFVFVVMDGSKQYFKAANGCYSKDELRWLDNTLRKYNKYPIIILQHFPLLKNDSKWVQTAKTDEYFEILDKYKNIKMVISGHYGQNIEQTRENVRHIITESYYKNHAYKIIRIDSNDNLIETYLVK